MGNRTELGKLELSKIETVDENEELSIEDRMKNLPHWKYGAAFENYMEGITTVTPDVRDEFMKLYKIKNYK